MTALLVTGGAGFIGTAIVEDALRCGWRVRVLDSLRTDVHAPRGADAPPLDPRVDWVIGDVRDARTVDEALTGIDLVSHQAAKVGLGVSLADAPDYTDTNVTGTAVLLAGMAARGIGNLVVASSMVVYGEGAYRDARGPVRPGPRSVADLDAGRFDPLGADGEPLHPELIDESAPLDPRNVYALSKLAQEQLAAVWARSTGGRSIALRYHNVYGPGMPQNTPYAGVGSLFRSALERGEAPQVFEDGRQRRDFVHVRDVAGANLAALHAVGGMSGGSSRVFNVGSGVVHTIGELASTLSAATGGPEPEITGEYRLGDVRHITASSRRIADELGWRAQLGFDEGVREFATSPLRAAVRTPADAAARS